MSGVSSPTGLSPVLHSLHFGSPPPALSDVTEVARACLANEGGNGIRLIGTSPPDLDPFAVPRRTRFSPIHPVAPLQEGPEPLDSTLLRVIRNLLFDKGLSSVQDATDQRIEVLTHFEPHEITCLHNSFVMNLHDALSKVLPKGWSTLIEYGEDVIHFIFLLEAEPRAHSAAPTMQKRDTLLVFNGIIADILGEFYQGGRIEGTRAQRQITFTVQTAAGLNQLTDHELMLANDALKNHPLIPSRWVGALERKSDYQMEFRFEQSADQKKFQRSHSVSSSEGPFKVLKGFEPVSGSPSLPPSSASLSPVSPSAPLPFKPLKKPDPQLLRAAREFAKIEEAAKAAKEARKKGI